MTVVTGFDILYSGEGRKRVGAPYNIGEAQCGFTRCGDQFVNHKFSSLGEALCGEALCGDFIDFFGCYRKRKLGGKVVNEHLPFMISKNPRTIPQQAQRQKYADGVAAWQALTESQKEVYNKRAKIKKFFGYHLFLKEYLLSH